MLSIEMIRAFVGKSSLPVYECNADDVRERGCRVLPPEQVTNLPFSAWRLAHAVKKADCARWPSSRMIWPGAVGFFLENIDFFDWSSETFSLNSCMSDFYADFSRTSLSGRIGQGMALLFLEKEGYSYIGHFSTIIKQYMNDSKAMHKITGRTKKYPDFVVGNDCDELALAEAKGSFVPPKSSARIKGALNKALDQLAGWNLSKGFAIGTFLREIGDSHKDSSLTAFIDVAPRRLQAPSGEMRDYVEFPPDAIRRANYASWLSLMSFDDAARRLRAREGRPEERTVPILTLGGHQYIVKIASIRPSHHHHAHDPDFQHLIEEGMDWLLVNSLFDLWGDNIIMEIIGLNLSVVRIIQKAIQNPKSRVLMEIQSGERRDIPSEFSGGEFHGSIFSDGSLIGEIVTSRLKWRGIGKDKVTL